MHFYSRKTPSGGVLVAFGEVSLSIAEKVRKRDKKNIRKVKSVSINILKGGVVLYYYFF